MTMKRKIILTVLLGVLAAVAVWCVVYDILLIRANLNDIKTYEWFNGTNDGYYTYKNQIWKDYIIPYIIFLIPLLVSSVYFVVKTISIWTNKISLIVADINYTYQDYKIKREAKRQIKAEKKKKAFLDKISKM